MSDITKHFQDEDRKKRPPKITRKALLKADDVLEAIGHDNEDIGAKATIETQSQAEHQEREKVGEYLEQLDVARATKQRYQLKIARQLYDLAKNIDFPRGYTWKIALKDEDKVSLSVKDKNGNVYGSGIKVTGMPFYDMNALQILANQAENTVDKLEGNLAWQRKTSRLTLPNTTIYKADGTPYEQRKAR